MKTPRSDETLCSDSDPSLAENARRADGVANLATGQCPLPDELQGVTRYLVQRQLGEGGFGKVYLAFDQQLAREVAIKIPSRRAFTSNDGDQQILHEARAAAKLRHPGIVTVYDAQKTPTGCFVVLEYVPGKTLAEWITQEPMTLQQVTGLMVQIAEALVCAHAAGVIHRDLKPSNVLVDAAGQIRITDFGLAVHINARNPEHHDLAGTPAFMSPEQVRGEAHRFDQRTDLWSLGVIFYLLMTGRRPFQGTRVRELFDTILQQEPDNPRALRSEVPRELERICLRCLAKRMSERYESAQEFVTDLKNWQGQCDQNNAGALASTVFLAAGISSKSSQPAAVVPKGFRAFDQHDAEFFLSLVPGPKDRYGLPDSVRFWKQRLESHDPAEAFPVGLMYGPSGCGKTSLVRAGIIPHLKSHVQTVYVEATSDDFETRIMRALRHRFPQLEGNEQLADTMQDLREGQCPLSGTKIVFVLDQFEQWLHGRAMDENMPLIRALRQCDGVHLQCVVLVRDEFALTAARFMRTIEVPIQEGHNCAVVDLFDLPHARRVLTQFGEALGKLDSETDQRDHFVQGAIDLLAEDDYVVPVRLVAFAELVRHQRWDDRTLRQYGCEEGLGVALLDRFLGDDVVDPLKAALKPAAQAVLSVLSPEGGTRLKGDRKTKLELAEACHLPVDSPQFEHLLNWIDNDLRLISPAASEEDNGIPIAVPPAANCSYQLAHDYLVPAIRSWLTRKERRTRAGRARLLLRSLSDDWSLRPSTRYLPTFTEWVNLHWRTNHSEWNDRQARMMSAASRFYWQRLAQSGAGLLLIVLSVFFLLEHLAVVGREERAQSLARLVLSADLDHLATSIEDMREVTTVDSRQILVQLAEQRPSRSADRFRALLVLAERDPAWLESLLDELPYRSAREHAITIELLRRHAERVSRESAARLSNGLGDPRKTLSAACLLSALASSKVDWSTAGPNIASALLKVASPSDVSAWAEMLKSASPAWQPTLCDRFRAASTTARERLLIAFAVTTGDQVGVDQLAHLLLHSTPETFQVLVDHLKSRRATALPALSQALQQLPGDPRPEELESLAQRRATGLIGLWQLGGQQQGWSQLARWRDPATRTAVIDMCGVLNVEEELLLEGWAFASDPDLRQLLLISLAEILPNLSPAAKTRLNSWLQEHALGDPGSGVHLAAEWLARRAGMQLPSSGPLPVTQLSNSSPGWYVNGRQMTLVVVPGPREGQIGSPAHEPDRDNTEQQRSFAIPYSFAIGNREVTIRDYQQFQPDFEYPRTVVASEDCPITNIDWLSAVRYCRWLSEIEQIPEQEQCYPPLDQIRLDMVLPENFIRRTGYRLPLEGEWEIACRAGTTTTRFFGDSAARLPAYAHYSLNSQARLHTVAQLRPNPWGLFDLLGNAGEWCHRNPGDIPSSPQRDAPEYHEMRGGTYRSVERELRSARRDSYRSDSRLSFLGFRIARTMPAPAVSQAPK